MNYIVLSDRVYQAMEEKYNTLCETYGYDLHLDAYLYSVLSFDSSFRLLDTRRSEGGCAYTIVGKGCTLGVDEDIYHKNCLYARRVSFYAQTEDYCKKLRRTVALPGCWLPVSAEEARGKVGEEDISSVLAALRPGRAEFLEFQEKWETWDLYNRKLQERERKKEKDSALAVERITVENDLVTIYTYDWNEDYQPEKDIYVRFEDGPDVFRRLGQIEDADGKNHVFRTRCENRELLYACMDGSRGRVLAARIIDAGSRARIKRQR